MCGISGKIYFNKDTVTRYQLQKMASIISHRGPDDTGYYISKKGNVGFAHNRLSIIDLSKRANQPMGYMNRYVMVFNGEIYNFQEERNKLQNLGYKFKTTSDSEVILALYDKYKEKCLLKMRGMFAFAIYDTKEQQVFIARDRVGKKPLKYFLNDKCLIFASELKAILTQPEVKNVPDYIAIQKYLIYGYIPAPLTGFEGIKKLEPGHYMKVDIKNKKVITRKYWEPVFTEKLFLSEKEWSQKILDVLDESTRLRMISDVPVGAFLSGGVDSSAVVAAMALNSNDPIRTFTIKYKNKRWSEDKFAKIISKTYKTDHTEILAKPTNINNLPRIAYQYEEPFADNSALVSFMVCEEARKHVKVTLNGDGGDENFAGYPNRYNRLKRDVDLRFIINLISKFPIKTGKSKIDNFIQKSKDPIYKKFASYNRIFHLDDYSLEKNIFDNFKGNESKDAGLKFDLRYFLSDQLLTKMDIASMAFGLETRSPLLDQNMIELGCKIPFNLKLKNGETKYIFKKALEKIVPKENLYRPKMGFTISLEDWFQGDLKGFYDKKVNSKKSKINNLVNTHNLEASSNQQKWSLLMLELWFEKYF